MQLILCLNITFKQYHFTKSLRSFISRKWILVPDKIGNPWRKKRICRLFSTGQSRISHVQVYWINFQIQFPQKLKLTRKNCIPIYILFLSIHKEPPRDRLYMLFGRILYVMSSYRIAESATQTSFEKAPTRQVASRQRTRCSTGHSAGISCTPSTSFRARETMVRRTKEKRKAAANGASKKRKKKRNNAVLHRRHGAIGCKSNKNVATKRKAKREREKDK